MDEGPLFRTPAPTARKKRRKCEDQSVKAVTAYVRIKSQLSAGADVTSSVSLQVSCDGLSIVTTDGSHQLSYGPYNGVWDGCTTEEIFEAVCPNLLSSLLEGTNMTIMVHGPTGSGKTYTMFGDGQTPGLLQLSLRRLEQDLYARSGLGYGCYSLSVAAYEVYNDTLITLLTNTPSEPRILERDLTHKLGVQYVLDGQGLHSVASAAEAVEALTDALKRRTTDATRSNATSSRSNAVVRIELSKPDAGGPGARPARLYLVDLAGSETAGAATSAAQQKEGMAINTSLLELNRAMAALAKGDKPSWNSSVLTKVLEPALDPAQARTVLIATVSRPAAAAQAGLLAAATPRGRPAMTRNVLQFAAQALDIHRPELQIYRRLHPETPGPGMPGQQAALEAQLREAAERCEDLWWQLASECAARTAAEARAAAATEYAAHTCEQLRSQQASAAAACSALEARAAAAEAWAGAAEAQKAEAVRELEQLRAQLSAEVEAQSASEAREADARAECAQLRTQLAVEAAARASAEAQTSAAQAGTSTALKAAHTVVAQAAGQCAELMHQLLAAQASLTDAEGQKAEADKQLEQLRAQLAAEAAARSAAAAWAAEVEARAAAAEARVAEVYQAYEALRAQASSEATARAAAEAEAAVCRAGEAAVRAEAAAVWEQLQRQASAEAAARAAADASAQEARARAAQALGECGRLAQLLAVQGGQLAAAREQVAMARRDAAAAVTAAEARAAAAEARAAVAVEAETAAAEARAVAAEARATEAAEANAAAGARAVVAEARAAEAAVAVVLAEQRAAAAVASADARAAEAAAAAEGRAAVVAGPEAARPCIAMQPAEAGSGAREHPNGSQRVETAALALAETRAPTAPSEAAASQAAAEEAALELDDAQLMLAPWLEAPAGAADAEQPSEAAPSAGAHDDAQAGSGEGAESGTVAHEAEAPEQPVARRLRSQARKQREPGAFGTAAAAGQSQPDSEATMGARSGRRQPDIKQETDQQDFGAVGPVAVAPPAATGGPQLPAELEEEAELASQPLWTQGGSQFFSQAFPLSQSQGPRLRGPAGKEAAAALFQAVTDGAGEEVLAALDTGADPNLHAAPKDGQRAIHVACAVAGEAGAALVLDLLRARADPLKKTKSGRTALHVCAQAGSVASARLLLANLRVLNKLDEPDNSYNTALHLAAKGGHGEVALALLRAGAKAQLPNKAGKTPAQLGPEEWRTHPKLRAMWKGLEAPPLEP
ncbi:hypothetical protein HYH03_016104 [Edaphochlamys debaryana]|uniref:Kinesin motor domain-containing protein n=1 Tax=Edaphochlamys debaryana TaxID=47281 RepID=A0A835XI48_9CHLO|nr:hypothetical protein HYH03_016104 [Edaphochlamys debaryana]|eukprot:KAG2485117.1 hypothetical protein HYH03_016104 [Edaphochlamys debaryana]